MAAAWPWSSRRAGGAGLRGGVRRPGADGPLACGPGHAADPAAAPTIGRNGGAAACHRRTTPSNAPGAWGVTLTGSSLAPPTSPRWRPTESLLAATEGQVLTTLPGVAVVRAAGFAAQPADQPLPGRRTPVLRHRLGPSPLESATVRRRGRISRQGLAEHRDALMVSRGACSILTVVRPTRPSTAAAA